MLWLLFGLGAALGDSGADALTKRFFSHLSPYGMALARLLSAVPFLLLAAPFIRLPALGGTFWLTLAAMLPLEAAATLCTMRALKVCHLSLCVPFLAFTPVFLILTGWLVLGEALNSWGVAGTLLVAAGSYLLSLDPGHFRLWAPLAALSREPGARLMLAAAALYSGTAALYKLAVLNSDPLFFGIVYPLAFFGVMATGYPLSPVSLRPSLTARYSWAALLGFSFALSSLALASGIGLAPVTYLIAVKRLSLLFSVLLGGLWLKERPFLPRLSAAALMSAGVILITLKG